MTSDSGHASDDTPADGAGTTGPRGPQTPTESTMSDQTSGRDTSTTPALGTGDGATAYGTTASGTASGTTEYGSTEPGGTGHSTSDRTADGVSASPAPPRGPRVGTAVWGLVVAAVGVGLLALGLGAEFDVELAVIALVAAAGVALLIGSVAAGARRRSR